MPTTCEFEFLDNPLKAYYSGEHLNGQITLKLDSPTTVRGIYILFEGIGYCKWETYAGRTKQINIGKEIYLSEKEYFVGGGNDKITIQPGVYNYDFHIQLPAKLPTSLETKIGYIRYTATVKLDRPLWIDQTFGTTFTVIRQLNLNNSPIYRLPVEAEERKQFFLCCFLCCFKSKPLIIHARTPVGGYIPGQTIKLKFTADNSSDYNITKFTIQLIKRVRYSIGPNSRHKRHEDLVITEKEEEGCLENEEITYQVNLDVGIIRPTDFTISNVCKVEYLVRITGKVKGCHANLVLELPVIIGTCPILDDFGMVPFEGTVITEQASASLPSDILSPCPSQDV